MTPRRLDARWPTRADGTNKTIGEMTPAERDPLLRPVEDQVRAQLTPRRRPSSTELTKQELANLRPIERACVSPTGRVEFRIQRELRNDNARNRNPHWSKKNTKRLMWQASLSNALVLSLGYRQACALLVPESGLGGAHGTRCADRRRIEITRVVPSKRRLVKDTFENLPMAAKELRDAIKNLGLIHDDSTKWTDTTITQELSVDATWWTYVVIDAPLTEGPR